MKLFQQQAYLHENGNVVFAGPLLLGALIVGIVSVDFFEYLLHCNSNFSIAFAWCESFGIYDLEDWVSNTFCSSNCMR